MLPLGRLALAALLTATLAPAARAQDGGMGLGMAQPEPFAFYLTTTDGSRVGGNIESKPLRFRSETLGVIEVPFERIASLQLGEVGLDPATDRHANFDILRTEGQSLLIGRAEFDEVRMETEFGPLTIPRDKLRLIQNYQKFVESGGLNSGMMMGGMGGGGFGGMMGGGMGGMMMGGRGGMMGGPPPQDQPKPEPNPPADDHSH